MRRKETVMALVGLEAFGSMTRSRLVGTNPMNNEVVGIELM
jgi:hypothetical protein